MVYRTVPDDALAGTAANDRCTFAGLMIHDHPGCVVEFIATTVPVAGS